MDLFDNLAPLELLAIDRDTTVLGIPEDREELSVPEPCDIIDANVTRDRLVPIKPGDI
jgi:hypothetical protein